MNKPQETPKLNGPRLSRLLFAVAAVLAMAAVSALLIYGKQLDNKYYQEEKQTIDSPQSLEPLKGSVHNEVQSVPTNESPQATATNPSDVSKVEPGGTPQNGTAPPAAPQENRPTRKLDLPLLPPIKLP